MEDLANRMNARKNEEETKYADALTEINMAYSKIPAFVRKNTLEFNVKGKYSVTMYRDLTGHGWVSALTISDGKDAARIEFAMDGVTDYRKLSLAASKEVEEAQRIRPGLEWVLLLFCHGHSPILSLETHKC